MEGLVLDQTASHYAGGISRVEKAKIGLIQFCISPPKTDVRRSGFVEPNDDGDPLPTNKCGW